MVFVSENVSFFVFGCLKTDIRIYGHKDIIEKGNFIVMYYGYHKTSTKEQHLDRGITEITSFCERNNIKLEKIYTDQQTGKNFNRPRYTVLKEDILRPGDTLIITELDRMGRNKREILIELRYFADKDVRVTWIVVQIVKQ